MNPYAPTAPRSTMRVPWYRHRTTWMLLIFVYVSSYVVASRRAFAKADEWQLKGVWFALPDDGQNWRVTHYALTALYFPLIAIDSAIGTGRPTTNEPTWSLAP